MFFTTLIWFRSVYKISSCCWFCIHFWIKWELWKTFDTKMIGWTHFSNFDSFILDTYTKTSGQHLTINTLCIWRSEKCQFYGEIKGSRHCILYRLFVSHIPFNEKSFRFPTSLQSYWQFSKRWGHWCKRILYILHFWNPFEEIYSNKLHSVRLLFQKCFRVNVKSKYWIFGIQKRTF